MKFFDLDLNFDFGQTEPKEVKDTKRLIEETERKKSQLLKVADMDIGNARTEMEDIYRKIGETVYSEKADEQIDERIDIEEAITRIREKKQELQELEDKRAAIEKRYGEELEMLKKLLPQQPTGSRIATHSAPGQDSTTAVFCTNCGEKRLGEAAFCTKCGTKY